MTREDAEGDRTQVDVSGQCHKPEGGKGEAGECGGAGVRMV